jgi:hypothetical protein
VTARRHPALAPTPNDKRPAAGRQKRYLAPRLSER